MTEEELNLYRLTSMEEPTDEMLSIIMKEAAEDARRRNEEAMKRFFDELHQKAKEIKREQEKEASSKRDHEPKAPPGI